MADFGQALLQQAIGSFAPELTVATAAIQKVVDAITQWVTALNPQLMNEFNRAIKDLQATLGTAFQNIFAVLTGVIRQVAGIILPVMQALKPVVDQLIEVITANVIPNVRALAAIVEALVPIISILASVFELIQTILRPLYGVIEVAATIIGAAFKLLELALTPIIILIKLFSQVMDGVVEVFHLFAIIIKTAIQTVEQFIKSLFGGLDIKKVFEFLQVVIMKVISAMLQLVVFIAKAFGQDAFVKNLIDNLKKEGQGGATAAGQIGFSGFEEVNKSINLAAAQAAGAAGGEKKFDLGDVVKELEKIAKGENFLGKIAEDTAKILEYLQHPIQKTGEAVVHTIKDNAGDAIRGRGAWGIVNPVGALGGALGAW